MVLIFVPKIRNLAFGNRFMKKYDENRSKAKTEKKAKPEADKSKAEDSPVNGKPAPAAKPAQASNTKPAAPAAKAAPSATKATAPAAKPAATPAQPAKKTVKVKTAPKTDDKNKPKK